MTSAAQHALCTPSEALSVADFEGRARNALDGEVWDWLAGGAERERTLAANRVALDQTAVVPRVLTDVALCDTAASLLGRPSALPVAVAPVAYQRLFHPAGEGAAARAAAAAGVPFIVSTLSSTSLDELSETGAELWFQLYWLKDRGRVLRLVRRAEEAGCHALVVTVDVPVMGRRLRDARNAFALPPSVRAVLLDETGPPLAHRRTAGASAVAVHTSVTFSQSVTWADLAWLRQQTRLPLVVKGVLDPEDAALAAETGASAVVVSNHGGRQLDGAVPTAVALPRIVKRLAAMKADHCQVLADSGVRSGSDTLTLLALGARAVLLGRPMIWGLAVDGEQGCREVLGLFGTELRHAMQLAGCPTAQAARQLRTVQIPRSYGSDT
ncbi:alpha-hydroxy-acid oxidizing protein [Streptomyces sp. NPDC018045]|uniref:alpha-hydroxy acid oxidase n=1 Tax=Streptomyces sp. NPDC018045 TaxID=3365037 RepID=UPI0037AE883F